MLAMLGVGGEHTMEEGKVDSWLGHQGGQPGDEIQRLEDLMSGAVAIGGFLAHRVPYRVRSVTGAARIQAVW